MTRTGIGKRTKGERSNSPLKIGIVGYGYWGPKLARNFWDLENAQLEVVADLSDERVAKARELYPGIKIMQGFDDLLNLAIDAIVIATPVNTHYELAKRALEAGTHVLVEKPITTRADQAAELIQIADEKRLVLMVGHTFVYNAAVEAVKDIVDSGELGEIYYLNSVRVNLGLLQPDINVMWDLAPHDISMLRYILESEVAKVSAHGACYINSRSNMEEVAFVTLRFENDILSQLNLSWLDPVKQRKLTVVGSKKMLVYDDIAEDKVIIYDRGVEVPPYSVTEEEFHASYRHGGERIYPLEWREPLRMECSHFVDCIMACMNPRSGGRDGLKVVQVLEAAQRSLMGGGVEFPVEY